MILYAFIISQIFYVYIKPCHTHTIVFIFIYTTCIVTTRICENRNSPVVNSGCKIRQKGHVPTASWVKHPPLKLDRRVGMHHFGPHKMLTTFCDVLYLQFSLMFCFDALNSPRKKTTLTIHLKQLSYYPFKATHLEIDLPHPLIVLFSSPAEFDLLFTLKAEQRSQRAQDR